MSGRRKTLGPLSLDNVNNRMVIGTAKKSRRSVGGRRSMAPVRHRQSLGPRSRMSMAAMDSQRKNSLGRRKSSIGRRQSSSRRGSTYGGSGATKIQDPRPITSKAFVQGNIRKLITFLTLNGYPHQLSRKSVQSPTVASFRNILEFLLQKMDPNFEFSGDKFEEEVKQYFAFLNYPFQISKSSLCAVGSPHTWPSILAALVWLIELIEYNAQVEQKNADELGGFSSATGNSERLFFQYLSESYQQFLAGEDDFEAIEIELARTFTERNHKVNEEIQRFQQINETLGREIKTLKETSNTVAGLESRRADLLADKAKFTKLINTLEKHRTGLLKKLAERKRECEAKENALSDMHEAKGELERQIEEQEFSPIEVQRMNQQKEMLERSVSSLDAQRDELQQQIWDIEMRVNKLVEECEKAVREFNQKCSEMQLIPSTAKYASGLDFEVSFSPQAGTFDDMVSVDLKRVIRPALLKLRSQFQEKSRSVQEELHEVNEHKEQADHLFGEKSEEVEELRERLQKLENMYKEERDSMNRELKKAVNEVQDIELEMHRLRTTTASDLAHSEKQLDQVEQELQQVSDITAEEQEALHREICGGMERFSDHKNSIAAVLQEMRDQTLQIAKDIASAEDS